MNTPKNSSNEKNTNNLSVNTKFDPRVTDEPHPVCFLENPLHLSPHVKKHIDEFKTWNQSSATTNLPTYAENPMAPARIKVK